MLERALVLVGPWTDHNMAELQALRLRFGLTADVNFRTMVITGELTDDHIKAFVAAMVAIERTNPAATYNALIIDPESKKSPGEMMQMIDQLRGPIEPGRERTTAFIRLPKRADQQ